MSETHYIPNKPTKHEEPNRLIFYHTESTVYISLDDLKKNTTHSFKFNIEKQCLHVKINTFELLTNNTISIISDNCKFYIIFDYELSNATLQRENNLNIIRYNYTYERKYRGYTIDLRNICFDYTLVLEEGEYSNLYYFENEYGRFRVDLSVGLS